MPRAVLSGNSAQSYAAKLARVQVISAYPITPQTTVVEKLADFVASGELPAQFVKVESEDSAMQVGISAASPRAPPPRATARPQRSTTPRRPAGTSVAGAGRRRRPPPTTLLAFRLAEH